MDKSIAMQLAEKIARDIFSIGDEPESQTKRIAFIGGEWPDKEKNQGGLGEYPLACALARSISDHMCDTSDNGENQ